MPPGVINMLPGDGLDVSKVALSHPDLAGIHFTGSTPTFQHLWRTVGENIASYRSYPRIVGETGGKDFVVAHPSADPDVLRIAMIRGAFEFQGQKCSAASRAYVAAVGVEEDQATTSRRRGRGDRDGRRHRLLQLHGRGHRRPGVRQAQGGDRPGASAATTSTSRRRPDRRLGRLLRAADRRRVHRPDRPDVQRPSTSARSWPCTSTRTRDFEKVVAQMESFAPYALTGAIIAQDRAADRLGPQGAALRGRQLLHQRQADRRGRRPAAVRRRAAPPAPTTRPAPRSTCCAGPRRARIKETFVPPKDYRYPYMG